MTRLADDLARLAADAEPPPLDDGDVRRLIDRALNAPRLPTPETPSRSWVPAVAVAVAVAALAVVWLRPTPTHDPELLRISLPTGDHLVGTNAQFDVVRLDREDRRLELHSGTLLVDVAHVTAGQRFAITTAHLVATAKGTVFSVETDAMRSRVRVYEGIVEVTQGDDVRLLAAGTVWASDTRTLALAPRPRLLAPEIAQVIARREAAATPVPPRVVTAEPSAAPVRDEPAPAPVRVTPPSPSPPPPAVDLDTLLVRAQRELASGQLDQALATTELAAKHGATTGAWRVLAADALRGLGRAREAADTYELASRELTGTDAFEAGYSAAYLRFKELQDYDGALDALVTSRADAADSPLEERGLALHVKILVAANRRADATPIAERYLARFPKGELHALMESLLAK